MSDLLLVAGSRSFQPPADAAQGAKRYAQQRVEHMLSNASYVFDWVFRSVIHGGARGIDQMGGIWADRRGYKVIVVPADWDGLGKRAGYVRNVELVDCCSHAIVIWDGQSKGTRHTMDLLVQSGKPHVVVVATP